MRTYPLMLVLVVGLAACSSQTSNTYRAGETGKALDTRPAIVLSVREVTIEGDPDLRNTWYGPAVGAAGAGIGTKVAGGSNLLAVGAALLGAGVGYAAEEFLDKRSGYEYVLQDASDPNRTFVVVNTAGDDEPAKPGTKVTVISGSGYTRVIPVWTPTPSDEGAAEAGGAESASGGGGGPAAAEETGESLPQWADPDAESDAN